VAAFDLNTQQSDQSPGDSVQSKKAIQAIDFFNPI
jgi:hypothetical protein